MKNGTMQSSFLSSAEYPCEGQLSDLAWRSRDSKGRLTPVSDDPHRCPYERDYHRVLYSLAFRRLRNKTQVFYHPANDHLCTRMEHSLQVAAIASTICERLKLHGCLARAIAMGHDLGHPPYGHTGETALDELSQEKGLGRFFHEAHSLRVVDMMRELHGEKLNLTNEVRDGIVCHYGEISDILLAPARQRSQDVSGINESVARLEKPYTLEGCVVRYADRLAYLPADLQDALEIGVIKKRDIPTSVKNHLGSDSGEIIGTVIEDVVQVSSGKDYIGCSPKVHGSLEELSDFSKKHIYKCDPIERQKSEIQHRVKVLFDELLQAHARLSSNHRGLVGIYQQFPLQVFTEFLKAMDYPQKESSDRIVLDFIAGMTDNFAEETYHAFFPIRIR